MKALVFRAVGDIRLDDVPNPRIQEPTDAIVRLTASAICGTDLHFVRGTMAGMVEGTILGHEGVGVVEQLGEDVRNFDVGDRVVICSTIACGSCSYCRAGYFAQRDRANPNGPDAGTCFFGGPEPTGPVDGLQAERARIPFAHATLVKLPDEVSDEQAIPISDIFPTGWFGARLADVGDGDTVAVFAGGTGPDRVIDAVGVDTEGPEDKLGLVDEVAAERVDGDQWQPGNAPDQVAQWAIEAIAKAGTLGIIGVYPPEMERFPIGAAMNKNLTLTRRDEQRT